jgi:hypothetical protein
VTTYRRHGRAQNHEIDAVSDIDVTRRLFSEFGDDVPVGLIAATVRRCRRDLAGSPHPALPELVERLARQRLSDGSARARERQAAARDSPR